MGRAPATDRKTKERNKANEQKNAFSVALSLFFCRRKQKRLRTFAAKCKSDFNKTGENEDALHVL